MKNFTFFSVLLLLFFLSNAIFSQSLVINEFMASNSNSIKDEDNSYQDWIELYNNGSTTINLLGFGLSDDVSLPFKWSFPNVSLASNQYLLIWCSDKNRKIAGSPLHTNFKIAAGGENLYLTNTTGTRIDTSPSVNLIANVSYGRLPNGIGPYVYFGTPTPNTLNASTGYNGVLNPPVFSQNSGFFTSGFNLTISSPDSETTILYTLDGSEPDENNLSGTTYSYKNQYIQTPGQTSGPLLNNSFQTFQYSTPVSIVDRSSGIPNDISKMSSTYSYNPTYIPSSPIFKGTSVRAKVIKPGFLSSPTITKNYFVSPQGVNKFSLPVISINVNENNLYDYYNGIYVAGIDFDTWRAANPTLSVSSSYKAGNFFREVNDEKKANFSYYVNGSEVLNQDIGLRIRGARSRTFENKSFSVYARSDYGDETLDYKFFKDLPYTSFERITLSVSGADFYSTKFRDALCHQLCKTLRAEIEAYQHNIAFINGEYWGLMQTRERFDDSYFKRVYNTSSVDFLENRNTPKEGDSAHYDAMINYLNSNSMAVDANFDYIKTQMDPESFTDYQIANIFFKNSDWPNNNVYFWRNKIASYNPTAAYGLDGRWRWMFHDMDETFASSNGVIDSNTLAIATSVGTSSYNQESWTTLVLRKLLENSTFKIDFINRFADLLNTVFLPNLITAKIDEMSAVISPEIPGEIVRWKSPSSTTSWNNKLTDEKNFANARPAFQRDHIRSVFSISSNLNATLNVSDYNHGYIKMSTIDIKEGTPGITGNPYPWTGIYFSSIPIKLKATAKPGYKFSNWSGASSSTNPEITLTPSANFSITAVFVPDNTETSVPIYFWMMDGNIANGAQLTSLNSTYEVTTNGVIQYQSCNTGYPTSNGGKSSMERRNNPTSINYRQSVNNNIPYATSDMKGLQIKQPFQSNGLENTMIFNFSTLGYKKIKFSFAGVDEGAANAITIDYAVNSGTPVWTNSGLTSSSLPLTSSYQLFQIDFSNIETVDNNSNFKIRLRFTGPNMTADLGNRVTFNNIAVDGVKIPLSYESPNRFSVGTPITNLIPSTTRLMTGYTISPALPSGLTLNSSTGIISGTPIIASLSTNYVVTGTYSSGIETFNLNITINDIAPTSLSYASPKVFTKGVGIANLEPTSSGGAIINYSIVPNLPTGLSIDTATGIISGLPTVITPTATYTVTASNSGGSTSFGIVITVNDVAPSALSYPSPNVFTKNSVIAPLSPSVSGGAVVSYSVSPALPLGLSLNAVSGVISGTPSVISGSSTYTVTASNSGGSTSFGVVITVNDVAPSALSYPSPNVFTKNSVIAPLSPSVSGGAVVSYSVSPSLPLGLSLDSGSGVISGTPTVISSSATYTVTATNSGGSTSFDIIIAIENTLTTIENQFSQIKVYPNPFNDILHVSGATEIIPYEIYSAEGKLIQKSIINNSKIVFSNLPTGMYILKLFSDKGMVTKKIIKQ